MDHGPRGDSFVSRGININATYQVEVRVDPGCRGTSCVFRVEGTVDQAFGVDTSGPKLALKSSGG